MTRSSSSPKIRSRHSNESGVIRALVDRLGHDLEPSVLIGGWATFVRVGGEISLDIDLPYEPPLGGKLGLKVEVLAEYPDELSFEKWTLLKLEGVDPAVAAEVLDRVSTVDIEELPAMVGEAFDLICNIIRLTKADQKLLGASKRSWVNEQQGAQFAGRKCVRRCRVCRGESRETNQASNTPTRADNRRLSGKSSTACESCCIEIDRHPNEHGTLMPKQPSQGLSFVSLGGGSRLAV